DKGFIYGRRPVGTDTLHCPEVDILIHDNDQFRPILQIEDFVIVQAKATHAAIQVKRRMETDQLRKALVNSVNTREHFSRMCQGIPRSPMNFFSAVVFFDEAAPRKDGRPSETYRNCIKEMFADPANWNLAPDVLV